MSKKHTTYRWILCLLVASGVTFALQARAGEHPFCQQPYETICGKAPRLFEDELGTFLFEDSEVSRPPNMQSYLEHTTNAAINEKIQLRYQAFEAHRQSSESFLKLSVFPAVRDRLIAKFEHERSAWWQLRNDVAKIIATRTIYVSQSDPSRHPDLAEVARQRCGGFYAAFNDAGKESKDARTNLIFACLFQYSFLTKDGAIQLPYLARAYAFLGHEMSHSIGMRYDRNIARNYDSCLEANWNQKDLSPELLDELFADYWSNELVVDLLSEEASHLSHEEWLHALQVSQLPYCADAMPQYFESIGASDHPNNRLRMAILGSHPTLRKKFGCTSKPIAEYCRWTAFPH